MKTRAEDLEDAVKEALQMLARGRPADATETLSAALDAPTADRAVRCEARGLSPAMDTRKDCTCLGACRGEDGLGLGWRCVLGKEPKR